MRTKRLHPSRFAADETAAAAVEAAFALPILLLMIMGIFWFGYAQHQVSSMRYALQGASRQLILDNTRTEAQLETYVRDRLGDQGSNVEVTLAIATTAYGREATLTGTYETQFNIPFVGLMPVDHTAVVKTNLPALNL